MKDTNYYSVQGWMVNKLHLSGNELICYAIIYGFSQEGMSVFMGSLSYLEKWMNATKPTVIKALKSLVEKELIVKQEVEKNNVRLCYYGINEETKESLLGGSKETLPNNNILDNIEDNKKERKTASEYDTIIDLRVKDEQVKTTIYEFIKMRKLIKKPMTNRALELMIGKLQRIADNPQTAVEILEQSIMNNWQDIYELKNKKKASYGDGYNGEYDV